MFFITAVINSETLKQHPAYRVMRSRTFGYAPNLRTARRYVKNNVGSMRECLYDYIVIEKIQPGIHSLTDKEEWYKWDDKKWIPCDKPSEFLGVTNWALG